MSYERAALHHLGWIDLCERLAGYLATELAASRLEAALEADLSGGPRGDRADAAIGDRSVDLATVRRRFAELDELEATFTRAASSTALGEALARVKDVSGALGRARHGARLRAEELRQIRDLLGAVAAFLRVCDEGGDAVGPHLGARIDGLASLPDLRAALDRAIGDGPEGEAIVVDDASPALASARRRIRQHKQRLRKEAEALMRTADVQGALRDRYFTEREGRVVLPMRADAYSKGTTPGIIHDTSGSGGTLFVEPTALIAGNNALREAQLAAAAEVRRILEALSREVGEVADALAEDLEGIVALDGIRARLRLSQAIRGVTPKVVSVDDGRARLVLPAMRHPLLELSGVDVVANDMILDAGAALIISGPNAGGKTVALKTTGLCLLLAQAGIRLPTGAPATLPLFREVITDVGDDQSIFANLSTFSAHIAHVREALERAATDGPGTLVLLDEIAVGTDPEQGVALAEAILRALVDAGATAVITTHYERLKELAGELPASFVNAAVGFDLEAMAPTFRLALGVPGPSSAFAVARRLGLPEAVLADAEARVSSARRSLEELLLQVNAEREAQAKARAELEVAREETLRRLKSAREREAAALSKVRSRKQKAYVEAAVELRSLRDEVQRLRRRVREADGAEAIADGRRAERALRERLHEQLEPAKPAPGAPPKELEVGDAVHVVTLDAEGEVVSLQGSKVVVQVGAIRTTVRRRDLRPTKAPEEPRRKVKRQAAAPLRSWAPSTAAAHFGDEPRAVTRSVDNVVDLRGTRAEDAIRDLERFLDQALRADQDVVVIQHGHGSGALRQAVREHLGRLGYVRKVRSGLSSEGGAAVTVAWLDP
ncbi:MAG: Smr/MutS family protein [Nannocystaceae bacterium]